MSWPQWICIAWMALRAVLFAKDAIDEVAAGKLSAYWCLFRILILLVFDAVAVGVLHAGGFW